MTPCHRDASVVPSAPLDLEDFERQVWQSPAVAWAVIVGLPVLALFISLAAGLPLFAALMAASLLLATALVCREALVTFTGRTLRLLVAARLVFVLVLGALLLCTAGSAWVAIVSTLLVWLTADRLLGRRALGDLAKVIRSGA